MILAWLCMGFVGGVVAGSWVTTTSSFFLPIAGILAGAAFVPRFRRLSLLLGVSAAFVLGVTRTPPSTVSSPEQLGYYVGSNAQLAGVVAAEPDVRKSGDVYEVDVRAIARGQVTHTISGHLQIRTPRAIQLEFGDVLTVQGRLRPAGATSPGWYRAALARHGIQAEILYPRVVVTGHESRGWLGWIVPLREHLEKGINQWLPEPQAALLIAITLGAHSSSLGDLTQPLISTGLIHIIAISGIKVSMVAGTLHALARVTRHRWVTLFATLTALTVYILLTGATPSGERSGVMWALVFISVALGRGTVAVVSLAVAAAIMLAFEPGLISDIGFQLSVVGTAAILVFTPDLLRVFRRLPSPFKEAFCVTLAAQIGTFPIVTIGFQSLSIVSPVANAAILPTLPILIILGFGLGCLASVGWLASPLSAFALILVQYVIDLSTWLAGAVSARQIPGFPFPLIVLYYTGAIALAVLVIRRFGFAPPRPPPIVRLEITIAALAGAALLTWTAASASVQAKSQVYLLGTGDAVLVESSGQSALVGSSKNSFQLLERLGHALPELSHHLDIIAMTDPRAGPITGLQDVLAHYSVGCVLDGGTEYPSSTYAAWRALLHATGIPVYALRAGTNFMVGSVRTTVIAPTTTSNRPQDGIGILRFDTGNNSFLIAGASSRVEQVEVLVRGAKLRATSLIVDNPAIAVPAFVQAVHPRTVLDASRQLAYIRKLDITQSPIP